MAFRIVSTLVLILAASPALIAGGELTLNVGVRGGGEIQSSGAGDSTIDIAAAYGLTFDIPIKPDKYIAVLWSRQRSEADLRGLRPDDPAFELTIDYIQAGGVYRPRRKPGKSSRPFVMAALGFTRVDPDEPGFDSDLVLSGSLGGGAKFPLGGRLAIRIEGRAYITLNSASLAGVCGGTGCTVLFAADGALQFEGLAGLSIAF